MRGVRERKIVLVRHGRSAHVHAGWIDRAGFLRWREAYEAAGIAAGDEPPRELCELAASAVVVSSDIRRAVESAWLLSSSFETSPLLRELELSPPSIGPLRLPLFGWALAYGVRLLFRSHVLPSEHERAREAARWLASIAQSHGTVVAVTHHSIRQLIAKELQAEGWGCALPRKKSAHWSVWTLGELRSRELERSGAEVLVNPPLHRNRPHHPPRLRD